MLLAGLRTRGWRIPALSASIAVGGWAISCLLAPDSAAGSEGHAWAWATLAWAVVAFGAAVRPQGRERPGTEAALGPWNIGGRLALNDREAQMALARVVAFDGVDSERMAQMRQEMEGNERPEEIPATEVVILHDAEASKSLAIVFFDNEEDYAKGDAALGAMPASETPGQRTSVTKYEVAVRMAD